MTHSADIKLAANVEAQLAQSSVGLKSKTASDHDLSEPLKDCCDEPVTNYYVSGFHRYS
jgi:hypothetical protein